MGGQGLPEALLQEIRDTFEFFDKNGDGSISTEELGAVIKSLTGTAPPAEELQQMIREVDEDGDGSLDFDEFVGLFAAMQGGGDPRQDLREAFAAFDKDGDGFITRTEIKEVMALLGEDMTDAAIDAMISAADSDGDKRVDFEEFCGMILNAK